MEGYSGRVVTVSARGRKGGKKTSLSPAGLVTEHGELGDVHAWPGGRKISLPAFRVAPVGLFRGGVTSASFETGWKGVGGIIPAGNDGNRV
jgi:hypothetical protein